MQNDLIEPNGDPSPELQDMVYATVEEWIAKDDELGNKTQFIVVAVAHKDGKKSYWGMIDVPATPREDLYIMIMQRVYAGFRSLDPGEAIGFGLLDHRVVTGRVDIVIPPLS